MKKIIDSLNLCIISLIWLVIIFHVQSASSCARLKYHRDSLVNLLSNTPAEEGARRLELLNHLCDIGFTLRDSTYFLPCWNEAQCQNDILTMDDLFVPVVMYYKSAGKKDSADIWIARCKNSVQGNLLARNLEYLKMMDDVRDYDNFPDLMKNLLHEQVRLNPDKAPYRAMRILYTLGAIERYEHEINPQLNMKPYDEYLEEALIIARKLPVNERFRFQRQILLGLSTRNIENARRYLLFVKEFFDTPNITHRPFYSRKSLISAYEKMIIQGQNLPKEELGLYYREIQNLLKKYPNDTPSRAEYFKARVNYYYNIALEDNVKALFWCDSLISIGYEYYNPCYYYESRVKLLGKLGRWEEGYNEALNLMHIRDSLDKINNDKRLAELQAQYEVDTYKRSADSKHNEAVFAFLLILLLIILLILGALYSRSQRLRNKVLLDQLENYSQTLRVDSPIPENNKCRIINPCVETSLQKSLNFNDSHTERDLILLFNRLDNLMKECKLFHDPHLTRDMLVEKLGVNKNKLSEAIMVATKGSLVDYITKLRLQEALLLINDNPDMPLNEVSDRVGFGTYSTFYRSFYKEYDVKPTEYKKHIHTMT